MIFQTAANVFVYGTLLRGMGLSHTLTRAKFLGHGRIEGVLYDLGHYPGLQQGTGCVYGELYAVDQNTLDELDCIEGYFPSDPRYSLYERQTVSVRLLEGASPIRAHSYFYRRNVNSAHQIVCGDYRRYLAERSDSLQWYIAYGSNMNSARLQERLRRDRVSLVEAGHLEGYALCFNKQASNGDVRANLVYRGFGHRCPFVAYRLDLDDIGILDEYEGEPTHYIHLGLPFPKTAGNPGLGHVYIAAPDKVTTEQTPSADYLQHLYLGYREHGFDVGTLPPL